jgi:hypothetical protein
MPGLIPDVFHSVRLHAWNVNGGAGAANALFDQIIRIKIEGPAFKLPSHDVHGLVVEMVVDRNLSVWLDGKKTQPVFRVAVAVITVL